MLTGYTILFKFCTLVEFIGRTQVEDEVSLNFLSTHFNKSTFDFEQIKKHDIELPKPEPHQSP